MGQLLAPIGIIQDQAEGVRVPVTGPEGVGLNLMVIVPLPPGGRLISPELLKSARPPGNCSTRYQPPF